jgi:hypothetical protein
MTLLAALHPSAENFEECFNTLQFATRCQSISTAPPINSLGTGGLGDVAVEQLMHQVSALMTRFLN